MASDPAWVIYHALTQSCSDDRGTSPLAESNPPRSLESCACLLVCRYLGKPCSGGRAPAAAAPPPLLKAISRGPREAGLTTARHPPWMLPKHPTAVVSNGTRMLAAQRPVSVFKGVSTGSAASVAKGTGLWGTKIGWPNRKRLWARGQVVATSR